jgi:hypothetical protein
MLPQPPAVQGPRGSGNADQSAQNTTGWEISFYVYFRIARLHDWAQETVWKQISPWNPGQFPWQASGMEASLWAAQCSSDTCEFHCKVRDND